MLKPPLPMTKTFLTSTRFLPCSTTPLSRYDSARGAACTAAYRAVVLVNFLACCHVGVLEVRRCCLVTRGARQVEKVLKDARDLGVQSFSRTPLALRRARVDNAIEAATKIELLMTANKKTLTESSSAHEQEQGERVYQRARKQAGEQADQQEESRSHQKLMAGCSKNYRGCFAGANR